MPSPRATAVQDQPEPAEARPDSQPKILPGWAIATIVSVGVLLLASITATVWMFLNHWVRDLTATAPAVGTTIIAPRNRRRPSRCRPSPRAPTSSRRPTTWQPSPPRTG
ncbi:hypothetical protein IT882_02160 [Microbacterium schleiferi]|uniref:Uncharacterized protein n=1 Tax=Microbacterium schleiferi TaxID=69362 RepID=A0A7S8MYE1_9MICO|nr:hypothetical protein [Microbacterium schleiferi]QPE04948.1 hypothetical protein IT882_02160 [Microbacterium schleiferi]